MLKRVSSDVIPFSIINYPAPPFPLCVQSCRRSFEFTRDSYTPLEGQICVSSHSFKHIATDILRCAVFLPYIFGRCLVGAVTGFYVYICEQIKCNIIHV